MTESDDYPDADEDFQPPEWDASAMMRHRSKEAHTDRDTAIDDLHSSMSDDEILEDFGLDLRQIED